MTHRIQDQRRHPRFRIAVQVELRDEAGNTQILRTRDMCENGVYLEAGNAPLPQLGERIQLQVLDPLGEGEAPVVTGRVVRRDPAEGIGIQFDA